MVGGNNELKQEIQRYNKLAFENWLKQKNISFKFNPPNASHFGGVLEREIRSIRKVFFRCPE